MNSSKKSYPLGIKLLQGLVRGYQLLIAPTYLFLFGAQASCRFEESCSRYFIRNVEEKGFLRGARLGFARILSCHPWSGRPPTDQ